MPRSHETDDVELTRTQLRVERARLQRLRVNEAGVALAALLVSLTVLGVNFYTYRRGSEMVVLQPEQVAFYREEVVSAPTGAVAPGAGSLWVAMQVQMVNAAADRGDVVTGAFLRFNDEEDGRFTFNALVEPVISRDVERRVENCPEDARCLPATGFYVIERQKRLLDVPGGTSRTEYMGFQIEAVNCSPGDAEYCGRFEKFGAALDYLRERRSVSIFVDIEFHFDGKKTLRCDLVEEPSRRHAIFDYIEKNGWAMAACTTELS